jgi:hypothetical protein
MTHKNRQWKLHSYIRHDQGERLQAIAGHRGISPIIRAALDLYFAQLDAQEHHEERAA